MAEKKLVKKETAENKAQKKVKVEKKTGKEIEQDAVQKPEAEKARPLPKSSQEIERELKNFELIKFALISEKAVNMIERENKLTFIVNQKADKPAIKRAIEEMHKVRVDSVKIIRDRKGRKKAIVKINKNFKASDIATRLGVI